MKHSDLQRLANLRILMLSAMKDIKSILKEDEIELERARIWMDGMRMCLGCDESELYSMLDTIEALANKSVHEVDATPETEALAVYEAPSGVVSRVKTWLKDLIDLIEENM